MLCCLGSSPLEPLLGSSVVLTANYKVDVDVSVLRNVHIEEKKNQKVRLICKHSVAVELRKAVWALVAAHL